MSTKKDYSNEFEISINFASDYSLYFNLITIEDNYFLSKICFEADDECIFHKIDSVDGLSVYADYLITTKLKKHLT